MDGKEVRKIFESVLDQRDIERWAVELGVVERERLLDVVRFVRCLVLSAGTPTGGLQADALRNYLHSGESDISRSAFYQRFDENLERLMERISRHALDLARRQKVDLPGILAGVLDWWIVDATTIRLPDELIEEFPGTGNYAAIKVHKRWSLGCGSPIDYHFSPAKEHDSPHLVIDESWSGCGLIADLAYASLERLRACIANNVRFVIRLKDNWKPKVTAIGRGEFTRDFLAGADLDLLIDEETLLLEGKAVDVDATIGSGANAVHVRVVGVPSPKGYCFFLTNLPAKIGPLQVGDIYRTRWEVELSIKLDKSVHNLDATRAQKACAVRAMLHASLIASVITSLVAHSHNLGTRPKQKGAPRTTAPVHPIRLGLQITTGAWAIADAMELEGKTAERRWERLAKIFFESGKDPNWRRTPSVLDRIRGWVRQPPKATH